jgi:hypothetical protein
MEMFNRILIGGGNAVLWLWDAIKAGFVWLFDLLDAVLNPVLSPFLAAVNPVCTAIGDAVYAVLSPLPPWAGLTLLSAITGVVMLIAFRYLSNQTAIARAKDDIKAQLLTLKLYKDELRVTFLAQLRLAWAILRLQRYVLTPVLWMLLPMLLGLAQMGLRHQWRPLHAGELTQIHLNTGMETLDPSQVTLQPDSGVVVELGPTPAQPVPPKNALVWRVRGGEPGRHTLRIDVGDRVLDKELVVSDRFERVSAVHPGHSWTDQLLHPAERRLSASGPVDSIEILYPYVDSWISGADYWILTFFIISMATALIFKPVFKVRF